MGRGKEVILVHVSSGLREVGGEEGRGFRGRVRGMQVER